MVFKRSNITYFPPPGGQGGVNRRLYLVKPLPANAQSNRTPPNEYRVPTSF